jgi:hypothetical protein
MYIFSRLLLEIWTDFTLVTVQISPKTCTITREDCKLKWHASVKEIHCLLKICDFHLWKYIITVKLKNYLGFTTTCAIKIQIKRRWSENRWKYQLHKSINTQRHEHWFEITWLTPPSFMHKIYQTYIVSALSFSPSTKGPFSPPVGGISRQLWLAKRHNLSKNYKNFTVFSWRNHFTSVKMSHAVMSFPGIKNHTSKGENTILII